MTWEVVFFLLVFGIYNGVIGFLAKRLYSSNLDGLLQEKTAAPAPADPNPDPDANGAPGNTSASRVTGAVGAAVIASFTWAVGNVLIYKAVFKPEDAQVILDGIGNFYLAASALFAPYAFNQLSSIFKS